MYVLGADPGFAVGGGMLTFIRGGLTFDEAAFVDNLCKTERIGSSLTGGMY